MSKTFTVFLMIARLLFIIQLVVGLCLWFGLLTGGISSHMALGSIFVLVMWIVALIALFVLPTRRVALFTLLWGALVLWLGMVQTTLLPGSAHWAVRLAHLLVGVAAIGLVEALGAAVKRHRVA